MALAGKIGAIVQQIDFKVQNHGFYFGEDQARYIISCAKAEADRILGEARERAIPILFLGVTGGPALTLPGEPPISLSALATAHEGWLPDYMGGKAQA